MRTFARSVILLVVAVFGLAACGDILGSSPAPLVTLDIQRAEAIPGEPLLIMGWIDRDMNSPRTVEVRSSSGQTSRVTLGMPHVRGPNQGFGEPWLSMSDAVLAAFIGGYGTGTEVQWQASIGIIEEGAVRQPSGSPPTAGVSEATIARVIAWLREEGIAEVERQTPALAYYTVRLPRSVDFVRRLRSHPNIETVEPNGIVVRHDGDPWPTGAVDVYGVIVTTAGDGEGLRVQPGDVLTVSYRQPDGSVLRDTVRIVQP